MDFVEADIHSQVIARLSAAFPRTKIPPGLVGLLRERLQPYPDRVVLKAVDRVIDSSKSFPSLAEIVGALKAASTDGDFEQGATLDLSEEAFGRLTAAQRRMHAHAVTLLHFANAKRQGSKPAPTCAHQELGGPCFCVSRMTSLAEELVAHGIWIAQDGSRVTYDRHLIVTPGSGCALTVA